MTSTRIAGATIPGRFHNRLITRRKLLLVSAAYELPLTNHRRSFGIVATAIQDRTQLRARRIESARRIHDKIRPVALLVIRIRGIDLRTARAPRWSHLGVPSKGYPTDIPRMETPEMRKLYGFERTNPQ